MRTRDPLLGYSSQVESNPQRYLESIAKAAVSQSRQVRDLIGSRHWLSDGRHKEALLAGLIRQYKREVDIRECGLVSLWPRVVALGLEVCLQRLHPQESPIAKLSNDALNSQGPTVVGQVPIPPCPKHRTRQT